jgi:predicted ABC-type ATPase
MSHESKVSLLDIAKSKGYKTYLYFVYTDDPALNILRVSLRARMGLHNVTPEVVRSRYERSFALLPMAFRKADKAYVINNPEGFMVMAKKQFDTVWIDESISSNLRTLLS